MEFAQQRECSWIVFPTINMACVRNKRLQLHQTILVLEHVGSVVSLQWKCHWKAGPGQLSFDLLQISETRLRDPWSIDTQHIEILRRLYKHIEIVGATEIM